MAEKRIRTLAEVSRRTGIARATLTALYYGSGNGIKFGTLDTLCSFFGVGVGDILKHVADKEESA